MSTSPLTNLAGTSQVKAPMMTASPSTDAPYRTATISTMNRKGIERNTSTTRIMAESTMPPARPAMAPQSMPITMPIAAAAKPTSSAAWPPFISRASSSKPWPSVPSGNPACGDRSVWTRSELMVLP